MSHPHCFGDKQYTSNRDLNHYQIRRESDWFGQIYVCVDYSPPLLHYLPHTNIHDAGSSDWLGIRAVWLDICTLPPHQAYQYTSRQVLHQHRIGGESERFGRLYMSPLPITTLPIHITPGLKSTSDWWHFRAVWSDFHDSNPTGNRAIGKNTETRIMAGYERFPIGFLCFPSGCFKKPAAKRRKTGNGNMCFHPVSERPLLHA